MTFSQDSYLAYGKCHILARPGGGVDVHCCSLPAPLSLRWTPLSEISSQEEGICLYVHKYPRSFQVLPHSHQGGPLSATEKHPAWCDLWVLTSSLSDGFIWLGYGVPPSSWAPWWVGSSHSTVPKYLLFLGTLFLNFPSININIGSRGSIRCKSLDLCQ